MKALLVLLLAALSALPACRRAPSGESNGVPDKPSLLFQGFGARASHRGEPVWEARAVRARVFDAEQRAQAEDVEITYYVKGKAVSKAWAKHARMDLGDYDLDAEGDVRLRGSNGVLLTTPRLRWDNARQVASSSARVRVVRGGAVLTGRGFSADRELRDVRIFEDVQAEAVSVEQLRKEAAAWPAL